MLPKIGYDQLYKFVVSLGVLLAAAALAFHRFCCARAPTCGCRVTTSTDSLRLTGM